MTPCPIVERLTLSVQIDLFVYGTLMSTDIMRLASGHSGQSEPAILPGYFCGPLSGKPYPGIVERHGHSVEGRLYCSLSARSIHRLDVFEGNMYRRTPVEVLVDNGALEAFTYVIRPAFEHLLRDRKWSFEKFMRDDSDSFVSGYGGFAQLRNTGSRSST
jgi:gamma-glutamylcyclotransferase (GGCT)/AIG2-like uncharacterized protein YtfP